MEIIKGDRIEIFEILSEGKFLANTFTIGTWRAAKETEAITKDQNLIHIICDDNISPTAMMFIKDCNTSFGHEAKKVGTMIIKNLKK